MVHVTAFFAGILAFLYLGLAFHVIIRRYRLKLLVGDGGDADMTNRIRAHANFAEWVPFALLLMGLDEINGMSQHKLIFLGTALVLGRISHALSMLKFEPRIFYFRSIGMVTTFTVIIILAVAAVF
jgi:uncharacterized membrane protein YecN with MAPEG domain